MKNNGNPPSEDVRRRLSTGETALAVRRLLPYYKPYVGTVCFDLFCAALTTVCELVLPMLVRRITNAAVDSLLTARLILVSGGIYILLRLLDAAASYFMNSVGHIMGAKIETDLRRDLFGHLQKLSFSYFSDAKVGVLISRLTGDLFDITEFAHHCPEEFFIAGIKIVGAFVILLGINVPLTLILFAMLPGMVLCMIRFNRRMKDANKQVRREMGELSAAAEDSLSGVRVVKAFAGEKKEEAKFAAANGRYYGVKAHFYRLMGAFSCVSRTFDGLMYIITVMVGAFFILGGAINAADLVAYLLYVATLFASIRTIIMFTDQFYKGITGVERFAEVMDTEPEIRDNPGAKPIENARGEISFNDVTFRYGEGQPPVLSHLNLTVKAGEHLALAGPSGVGKTTLCALIPRFWDPDEGSVTLDGTDIRDITLHSLRDRIGVVEQDVFLFSGTVRENIAYGRADATEAEILQAARDADAYDFIMALPEGLDTYVGERGVKLSGGQKQRISIARVFLKNPPVLILDEATSALDNESERAVRGALKRLSAGRTTLTVAHRLTTIKNADRILVLTENGIGESGTHEELLRCGGVYAGLYALYTDDDAET